MLLDVEPSSESKCNAERMLTAIRHGHVCPLPSLGISVSCPYAHICLSCINFRSQSLHASYKVMTDSIEPRPSDPRVTLKLTCSKQDRHKPRLPAHSLLPTSLIKVCYNTVPPLGLLYPLMQHAAALSINVSRNASRKARCHSGQKPQG